jgi:hypothetical protein
MNKFERDDSWQKKIRDRILEPYYASISHNKRFVFVDKGKLADKIQKEMAIDTIIQLKNNGVLGIEEKIVRWPGYEYQNYTLEIMSCTTPGHEKKGWMYYATCDYLFYCFVQEGENSLYIHIIPFDKLKTWFFENDRFKNYKSFFTKQINRTETKIVPIRDVWNAIPECRKILVKV